MDFPYNRVNTHFTRSLPMPKKAIRLLAIIFAISILLACQSVPSSSILLALAPATATATVTSTVTTSPTDTTTNTPTATATITPTPSPSTTPLSVGFWITGDFHSHTWLSDGKH